MIALNFAKNLGLKFWLYILLALVVIGEQCYVWHKGDVHGQAIVKAQDQRTYEEQAKKDKALDDKRKADAVKAEEVATKKIADLHKQSDDDAKIIKRLSDAAKAKKAAQSPVQPSSDDVCSLSDDELQFYKKLIDKANNP